MSADGVDNVAPHSFTTVAGIDPPTLCFVSVGEKDTLRNARDTGKFVLNIGSGPLLHEMNESATNFPPSAASSTPPVSNGSRASRSPPPRVRAAPIVFECRVSGEYTIGNCVMVFGEIVHSPRAATVLAEDGLPDAARDGATGPAGTCRVVDPRRGRALDRIRYDDWEKGIRSRDL